MNKLHIHSDTKIKTCPVCQQKLKEINESAKELDKLGIWNIPRKIKKGVTYEIWKRRK